MKIKRRVKIVNETERKVSLTITKKRLRFYCPVCAEQVEMLSINEAAQSAGKSWREIVRLIDLGEIHSCETINGEIYICAVSISKADF